jgi:hypothetical protein
MSVELGFTCWRMNMDWGCWRMYSVCDAVSPYWWIPQFRRTRLHTGGYHTFGGRVSTLVDTTVSEDASPYWWIPHFRRTCLHTGGYHRFGGRVGTFPFTEYKSSTFFRNVGVHQYGHRASQPVRPQPQRDWGIEKDVQRISRTPL